MNFRLRYSVSHCPFFVPRVAYRGSPLTNVPDSRSSCAQNPTMAISIVLLNGERSSRGANRAIVVTIVLVEETISHRGENHSRFDGNVENVRKCTEKTCNST